MRTYSWVQSKEPMNKKVSQWPVETVLVLVGIGFLLVALLFKQIVIRGIVITGKSLFFFWLILTMLAVLIRLIRGAAREIRALLRAHRRAIASLSVLMYLAATAVLIWIQIWLAKLALATR